MGKIIGVDLGTTNSVTAILDGPQARILENDWGLPAMRSVVGQKRSKRTGTEPEIIYGPTAVDNWEMAPRDTIYSVKRLMGRGFDDKEVQAFLQDPKKRPQYEIRPPSKGTRDSVAVVLGGKEYSPVEISAMILRKLRKDAEKRLGDAVTHCVITVPAYFSQIQKDATRKAGLLAGMKVIRILDEPTAAAIAFNLNAGGDGEARNILVFDLGGGTFDVSILMMAGGTFVPLDLEGDMWLGGDNFDQALVDHAVEAIKKEHKIDPTGEGRFMVALKKAAQKAKENLSSAQSAALIVPGLLKDSSGDLIDIDLEITRQDQKVDGKFVAGYETMISPLVKRAIDITKRALENAHLEPEAIHCVLLAGNATGIPLVQRALEEMFGPGKIRRDIHPKHCVALGAAITAARTPGIICSAPDPIDPKKPCNQFNSLEARVCANCGAVLEMSEALRQEDCIGGVGIPIGGIAPFHYGTQTSGDAFNIFIHKGDPFPTDPDTIRTQRHNTRRPNQRLASIPIYGGENTEKASLNERQGESLVILPPSLPENTPVFVKVWLDGDGVCDLSARLEDGEDLKAWMIKGEVDARAVEVLNELQDILENKEGRIPAKEMREFSRQVEEALEHLRAKRFDAALELAERLSVLAEEAGTDHEDPDVSDAENSIYYAETITRDYSWALEVSQIYRLNTLVEETKGAIRRGNKEEIKRTGAALKKTVECNDEVPNFLVWFVNLSGRAYRIRRSDPAKGAALEAELEQVIEGIRKKAPGAWQALKSFDEKVQAALDQKRPPRPGPQGGICPICKKEYAGSECEKPKCKRLLRGHQDSDSFRGRL